MGLKLLLCLFIFTSSLAMAATSTENRSGKTVELALQSGVDYTMATTQLSAMYFIDATQLMGVKVGAESDDDERQTNVSLQYKNYTGNSFYVAGEAFYLNTHDDSYWGDKDYGNYSSMGLGVRIGNQWTWKHFTLGCDWFGIGKRVGTFTKDDHSADPMTYTLLNLIVGASF